MKIKGLKMVPSVLSLGLMPAGMFSKAIVTLIALSDDTGLIDGFGGLLPEAQGEDYEEQAFGK